MIGIRPATRMIHGMVASTQAPSNHSLHLPALGGQVCCLLLQKLSLDGVSSALNAGGGCRRPVNRMNKYVTLACSATFVLLFYVVWALGMHLMQCWWCAQGTCSIKQAERAAFDLIGVIGAVGVGPVIEEFTFRWMVQKKICILKLRLRKLPSIFLSTGLFFLSHIVVIVSTKEPLLFQLTHAAQLVTLGFALGFAYYLSNSIVLTILMHCLWNALTTARSAGMLDLDVEIFLCDASRVPLSVLAVVVCCFVGGQLWKRAFVVATPSAS
jgi:membrane protease YdiL (CAAX protease family)